MVYTFRFFLSSKCSLFRNSNVFGSCIIHSLYTGCAKIKKFRRQKVNREETFRCIKERVRVRYIQVYIIVSCPEKNLSVVHHNKQEGRVFTELHHWSDQ